MHTAHWLTPQLSESWHITSWIDHSSPLQNHWWISFLSERLIHQNSFLDVSQLRWHVLGEVWTSLWHVSVIYWSRETNQSWVSLLYIFAQELQPCLSINKMSTTYFISHKVPRSLFTRAGKSLDLRKSWTECVQAHIYMHSRTHCSTSGLHPPLKKKKKKKWCMCF